MQITFSFILCAIFSAFVVAIPQRESASKLKFICDRIAKTSLKPFGIYMAAQPSSEICQTKSYPIYIVGYEPIFQPHSYPEFCASLYTDQYGDNRPDPSNPGLKPCIDTATRLFSSGNNKTLV